MSDRSDVIQKIPGEGCVILHHRSPGKIGQRIPATKEPIPCAQAEAMHRAIFANRSESGPTVDTGPAVLRKG